MENSGPLLIMKLEQTRNNVNRRFEVTKECIKFYRIYIGLRPAGAKNFIKLYFRANTKNKLLY